MKRFNFSLQKILSLRTYQKEKKGQEYQRILKKYKPLLDELRNTKQTITRKEQERREQFLAQEYGHYLEHSIELSESEKRKREIEDQLEQSRGEREEAKEAYAQARARVDALTRLESAQAIEHKQIENKKILEEVLEVYNAKNI